MSGYIDVDLIVYDHAVARSLDDGHNWNELVACKDQIDDIPTADVVEVVRCRDCKWYGIDELKKDGSVDRRYKPSVCYLYREHHEESWYCADAERRTE